MTNVASPTLIVAGDVKFVSEGDYTITRTSTGNVNALGSTLDANSVAGGTGSSSFSKIGICS